MKALTIYIAGPLTAETFPGMVENAEKAIDAGIQLIQKGHFPFIPHLSVWTNLRSRAFFDANISWDTWMRVDDAFLCKCDALLYLGSSRGADQELARAKELGLQIFYSVDEVPEVGVEE